MQMNETITITLGDQAENHVGMQKLGKLSEIGFSLADLITARDWFGSQGVSTELIDLNFPLGNLNIYPDDEAYILVVRQGIDYLLQPTNSATDCFSELNSLNWDKHARHNLCFGNINQEPNYTNGKGRIVSFKNVPLLKKIKYKLCEILNLDLSDLVAEGNYYYDITKCGIGYHGDSERKKVIGVRFGASIPLVYQWFYQSNPIGSGIEINLDGGDIYIMSEKATGNDWKKKNIYTLRHAAGAEKFHNI